MKNQANVTLLFAILFNALAHTLLKLGMIRSNDIFDKGAIGAIITITTNPLVVVGTICFGGSLLMYSAALSRISLTIAYPILTAGGFIVITLVSIAFFQEKPSFMQMIGLLFLGLGIWFIYVF